MASLNGTDKRLADDAGELARDVQRGAARVLDATSKGAKKLSRQVRPRAAGTLKDAVRHLDDENAVAGLIRQYPWTALSVVAVAGVLLGRALIRLR